jgi:hypothetical protein
MAEKETNEIQFLVPSRDAPGFLRRQREAIRFSEELTKTPSIETMDELIEFLLQFVTIPEDRDEAREALLDASQNQFQELLTVLKGSDENPTT